MKRKISIFSIPTVLLWLFAVQNSFLIGLPFIRAGVNNSNVDLYLYMGGAEYSGDIGTDSNVIYFVRFYPVILATVNVNQNVEGTYVGGNQGHNEVIRNVNWIRWTWTPCFDRAYAVSRSLSRPDGEPYWHPDRPLLPLLIAYTPLMLLLLLIAPKFSKFGNSVNSV